MAWRLATQEDYPSWGYMLANGATTIWERWELATGRGMNSHNHPMLASIGAWFCRVLARERGLSWQRLWGLLNRPGPAEALPELRIAKQAGPLVEGYRPTSLADLGDRR